MCIQCCKSKSKAPCFRFVHKALLYELVTSDSSSDLPYKEKQNAFKSVQELLSIQGIILDLHINYSSIIFLPAKDPPPSI